MPKPSLDEIFGSAPQSNNSRPPLDEIFAENAPTSTQEPDSISKNLRQGMNPVKAVWSQVAQHPFNTVFQGIPKTIAGQDSGDAFIDRSHLTPFTPDQREEYKKQWGEYPSKENELGLGDRFKASALKSIDVASAPANALIGPAGKLAVKIASKAPLIGNKIAEMALSPEFSQDAADFKYGHDARRVMKTMPDIVGSDAHSTKAAIISKTQETGQAIGDTIANNPKAIQPVGITEKDVIGHINEKISELNKADPKGNLRTVRALEAKKAALLNNFDSKGNLVSPIEFEKMTPQQIFDYKESKLGNIKYTGRTGVDESALNGVLQESRAKITAKMNTHMPELKSLNQDYGDLKSAQDAIDKVIFKGQKEGLSGIGIKNILMAGLNDPINRVKLARWLYTAPKEQISEVTQSTPGFDKAVEKILGLPKPLPQYLKDRQNIPAMDIGEKPNFQNPIPMGGKSTLALPSPSPEYLKQRQSIPTMRNPIGEAKFIPPDVIPMGGEKVKYAPGPEAIIDTPPIDGGAFKDFNPIKKQSKGLAEKSAPYIGAALAATMIANTVNAKSANEVDMNKIYQIESSNKANALNKGSQAKCIGQITPIVLKEWNNLNPKQRHLDKDLYDPKVNMKISDWYMNKRIPQMLKAKGLPDTIKNRLIAYNAGISHVGKSVLPKETYDYLQKYNKGS